MRDTRQDESRLGALVKEARVQALTPLEDQLRVQARGEIGAGATFDGAELVGLALIAGATLMFLLVLRALIRWLSETPEDT